jgi:hypothetical protein
MAIHVKQLLASRYLLYKSRGNWTVNQEERAKLLPKLYPDIKQLTLHPSNYSVFMIQIIKNVAILKLAHWYRKLRNQ